MIYDISKHMMHDLLHDERLISEVMKSRDGMTTQEAREKIQFAYEKCDGYRERAKPKPVPFPGEVCAICGGSNLIRTGVCFSCTDCGSAGSCG